MTATKSEKETGHKVIARLFDLPVRDMGGGLHIVSLKQAWMTAEERNLIVKATSEFISR